MIVIALAIVFAPPGLYFLMHHNHERGHCGWNRCQVGAIKKGVRP